MDQPPASVEFPARSLRRLTGPGHDLVRFQEPEARPSGRILSIPYAGDRAPAFDHSLGQKRLQAKRNPGVNSGRGLREGVERDCTGLLFHVVAFGFWARVTDSCVTPRGLAPSMDHPQVGARKNSIQIIDTYGTLVGTNPLVPTILPRPLNITTNCAMRPQPARWFARSRVEVGVRRDLEGEDQNRPSTKSIYSPYADASHRYALPQPTSMPSP